jgi:molybdate transport system ATP-binding protein
LKGASVRPFRAPGSSLFFEGRRLNRGAKDVEHVKAHDQLKELLPGTDWSVRDGEDWLVVGANGTGKSCLAQALCGRAMVIKGQVRFPHPNLCSQRDIAYLSLKSDQALLSLVRKVQENRVGWNRMRNEDLVVRNLLLGSGDDFGPAPAWLGPLGLEPLLDEHLSNLSTGQVRKVSIAQASS